MASGAKFSRTQTESYVVEENCLVVIVVALAFIDRVGEDESSFEQ